MDYYDDDPTGDDEVTALWNGQLPMDSVLKVLQHEIERHKAAQARIAELEARLAEQEWNLVTEKPKKSGRYLVWNRQYPQFEPECQFYDISTASWYTNDAEDLSVDFPTHWRPLPPPPAETE